MRNNMITIKAFGIVADKLNVNSITLENIGDTERLKLWLFENYPKLKNIQFSIAVNNLIINTITKIENGNEIALLPPFSGG